MSARTIVVLSRKVGKTRIRVVSRPREPTISGLSKKGYVYWVQKRLAPGLAWEDLSVHETRLAAKMDYLEWIKTEKGVQAGS